MTHVQSDAQSQTSSLQRFAQHLVLFIPTLEAGGAERVTVTLANGLAERGFRVTLLTVRDDGPFRSDVNAEVNVVRLGGSGVRAALPALIFWLRKNRPDVMMSLMTHTNIIAIVARAVSRVNVRLVISERISLAHTVPGLKSRLLRLLMRALYNRADHITVVTKAMVSEIVEYTGVSAGKVTAIYNPVIDSQFLRRSVETDVNLHPWFGDPDRFVILAVGRLDPQKGFANLLRAFAIVAQQYPMAYLIILGEGAHRPQLEAMRHALGLDARVAFPGFSANPFASMQLAKLFVLSSLSEGLPGVLVQAMACGARVVSTDCPTGPREILEDGKWGKLVPVDDTIALSSAIISTLSLSTAPDVRSRAKFFDEQTSIDNYLKIFIGSPDIIS